MNPVVFQAPRWGKRISDLFAGYDKPLLCIVGFLCALGLFIMYSAGLDHGTRFVDHGRNMLLALGLALLIGQFSPHQLARIAVPLYALGVALLLGVEFFGITKKGATRWLNIGITVIQPSELLKIATPLMLAWWFQAREGSLSKLDFAVAAFILLLPVGLIMKQPDLGTALLVLFSGLAVIYFAGLSWRYIVTPVVIAALGLIILFSFQDQLCAKDAKWMGFHNYQKQRVCTLLNPEVDPLGKGFHTLQGKIAIGSGGLFGKGYQSGTQTHLEFIPERTTDFVFTTYAEEFGLLGSIVLLCALLALVLRALFIALRGATLFARLLAGSISVIFFTYSFVNVGMVSGILPVVGVPLPFISYGGTAMLTLGMGIGILLSISKAKQLMQS